MTLTTKHPVSSSEKKADKLLRQLAFCFLILVFIATVFDAYSGYVGHNVWKMGDWLINYQGGFIRRGLLGETIFQLSRLTHVNPGYYAFLLQILCYAIFFTFSYLLLKKQRSLLPYALLVFSPFIYTFQLNDSQGGYRKEIIFFALLAFIAHAAKRYEHKKFEKLFYASLLLYPLLILTHEMLAVFLPYLLIVYISVTDLSKKNILTVFLLLLPSVTTLLVSIISQVTPNQITEIFNATAREGYALSGGAIAWLEKPASFGVDQVTQLIHSEHYIIYYVLIILLSALAFIPLRKQLRTIFNNRLSQGLVLISATGTIALVVVALDWGRFIYIHLVSLFLLSLISTTHQDKKPFYEQLTGQAIFHGKVSTIMFSLLFMIYTLCWHIPHCCSPAPYSHNYHQINAVTYIQPYINTIESAIK